MGALQRHFPMPLSSASALGFAIGEARQRERRVERRRTSFMFVYVGVMCGKRFIDGVVVLTVLDV
jgi:hypothetical protein